MELAGYFAAIRRWWTTLIIAAWVGGLAGYFIASGIPPTYEGHARILVGPVVGSVEVMRAAGSISYTYAELATSAPALEAARQSLGLPHDVEVVARAIPNETTRILAIRAEHGDPEVAAAIANTLGQNLIDRDIDGVVLPEGELSVVEPAVADPSPIAPEVTLIALVAAATGLLGAAVLVLLVEYFGNTVSSARELTELTRASFQGSASLGRRFRPTPEVPTIIEGNPESQGAAAIRMLATKVAYRDPERPTSSAMVVGTAPHDGTADLALGIATALSRAGLRVLVVDANEEAGELSTLLDIDGSPGLSDLLNNSSLEPKSLAQVRSRGPAVLSRGRNARRDLVDLETAQQVVQRLTKDYEIVILSAAPIHLSGSALVWARSTEHVLMVAERDRAKRDDIAYAYDNLTAIHASVMGTVLLDRVPRPRRNHGQSRRRASEERQRPAPAMVEPESRRAPPPRRSDERGH